MSLERDVVRVLGGVLVDGALSKLIVEQEDHTLIEIVLIPDGEFADSDDLLEHVATQHLIIPRFPAFTPRGINQKYNGNGLTGSSTRTTGTALNVLIIGGPLFSGPSGLTIDQFDLNVVTPGAAGAVYRMGLWMADNQDDPFSWLSGTQWGTLVDGTDATFDTTSSGVKTISPSGGIVVEANKWFAVGGVSQVIVSQPTIGASAGIFSPVGQSSPSSGVNSTAGWMQQTGVTDVLGDFIPNTTNLNNIGHGVGFRRSA